MNPSDDNTTLRRDDDRRLDLLVDGELGEVERCDLLRQLDQEPEGWRRCALAFLEAQCWKRELGAIARPAAERSRATPAVRWHAWQGRLGTLVAVAASFLVALTLGTRLRDYWPAGEGGPGTAPDMTAATSSEAHRATPNPAEQADPWGAPWQMVTLRTPAGPDGAMETIHLPAVRRDKLDEKWLESFPAPVPPDVLQALKRAGHVIEQRRELVPVQMNDGARLVVPVDQIEVYPAGRPPL